MQHQKRGKEVRHAVGSGDDSEKNEVRKAHKSFKTGTPAALKILPLMSRWH